MKQPNISNFFQRTNSSSQHSNKENISQISLSPTVSNKLTKCHLSNHKNVSNPSITNPPTGILTENVNFAVATENLQPVYFSSLPPEDYTASVMLNTSVIKFDTVSGVLNESTESLESPQKRPTRRSSLRLRKTLTPPKPEAPKTEPPSVEPPAPEIQPPEEVSKPQKRKRGRPKKSEVITISSQDSVAAEEISEKRTASPPPKKISPENKRSRRSKANVSYVQSSDSEELEIVPNKSRKTITPKRTRTISSHKSEVVLLDSSDHDSISQSNKKLHPLF